VCQFLWTSYDIGCLGQILLVANVDDITCFKGAGCRHPLLRALLPHTNDTNIIQYIPMCQDNPRIQDKENEEMSEPNGPLPNCPDGSSSNTAWSKQISQNRGFCSKMFEVIKQTLRNFLSKLALHLSSPVLVILHHLKQGPRSHLLIESWRSYLHCREKLTNCIRLSAALKKIDFSDKSYQELQWYVWHFLLVDFWACSLCAYL
jgi:hypothetical protein